MYHWTIFNNLLALFQTLLEETGRAHVDAGVTGIYVDHPNSKNTICYGVQSRWKRMIYHLVTLLLMRLIEFLHKQIEVFLQFWDKWWPICRVVISTQIMTQRKPILIVIPLKHIWAKMMDRLLNSLRQVIFTVFLIFLFCQSIG